MGEKREGIEQILQTCLELIRTGQESVDSALARYPDHADELSSLLETATWLQERRDSLAPRPEFLSASRQRLLARIEQEQKAPIAPKSLRSIGASVLSTLAALFTQKRFAYQFVIATFLLVFLVSISSGVAAAAQNAIPGDPLYGVKTTLEQAQLAISFSEARRAQLYVAFTERRLVEIQSLVIEGRFEHLHGTIDRFNTQANEASRLIRSVGAVNSLLARELAAQLKSAVDEQVSLMPVLSQSAPPESRLEVERLMQLADLVKGEAQNLEALMGGAPLPSMTPTLITITPASPTPVVTKTPAPTATAVPAVTLSPVATPMVAKTEAVPTVTVRPTRTPVPTVYSSGGKPTPTPTKAGPTRKPTKTKKPTPDPPNRPPKPTKKTSKNNG